MKLYDVETNATNDLSCDFDFDIMLLPDNIVLLDEFMSYPIKVLNEKGYKTLYCCEGHYEEAVSYKDNHDFPFDASGHIGKYEHFTISCPYITFVGGTKFNTIPEGWILVNHPEEYDDEDDETTPEMVQLMYSDDELFHSQDEYDVIMEKMKAMKSLYEWIRTL